MVETPKERACVDDAALPERKLIRMSAEEIATTVAIAFSVVHPPIQIGRGRKLPHQSDRDRQYAAELIVARCQGYGIEWFRPEPPPLHNSSIERKKVDG